MLTTLPTLAELQDLLDNCPGIFDTDFSIQQSLVQQETNFRDNILASLPNTEFPEFSFDVTKLTGKVQSYINDGFSHLGLFFGLEPVDDAPNSKHVICLIVTGVKFDRTDPSKRPNYSPKYFSTVDTKRVNNNNKKISGKESIVRFKNELSPKLQSDTDYNSGLYIKLDDFLVKLNDFNRQSVTRLDVSIGFISAANAGDWNCLHLIFRHTKGASDILFSTFEGYIDSLNNGPNTPPHVTGNTNRGMSQASETIYTGPKLGTPPFGQTFV